MLLSTKKFEKLADDHLVLFECCRVIEGYSSVAICDLQRSTFFNAPKDLINLLTQVRILGVKRYLSELPNDDSSVAKEYISYLLQENIGFLCSKEAVNKFPPLKLEWDHFAKISNATISFIDKPMFLMVSQKLIELGCQHFEIDIKRIDNIDMLSFLAPYFQTTPIKSIRLRIEQLDIDPKRLVELSRTWYVLESIDVFNSKYNSKVEKITFSKNSSTYCEPKSLKSLTSNVNLFLESQKHHSYFNRKIHIGFDGKIRNARGCETEFGSLESFESIEAITEIITKPDYQRLWFVRKEICDVCSDCELRHICVDTRLPYQREDNSWYHLEECPYNPYINKWHGEDGYKSLEECGVLNNPNEFSINHQKISEINQELWGA